MTAVPPIPMDNLSLSGGLMRRVGRNLGLLIGGKSVSAVLGLLYLAVAVRALGIEAFGQLVLVHTVVQATQTIVKFQSWQPVLHYGTPALQERRFADFRRLILFTGLLDLGSSVAGAVLAAVALWLFGTKLGLSADIVPAAMVYSLSLLFMVSTTAAGLLRLFDRFKLLIVEDNVVSLVRLAGCLVLFATGGDIAGFLVVWFLSSVAGSLVSVGLAWREVRRRGAWQRPAGRQPALSAGFDGIWKFVWSTNANSSLALVTNHVATLTTGALIGPAEAALFRIARQVAEAVAKPVKLMTSAVYPEFARFVAEGRVMDMRAFLGRALRLSALGACGCGLVLLVGGSGLLAIIGGDQVAAAYDTMLLLGVAALIGVGTFALEPALITLGRPAVALRIRLAAAVAYLPALAMLVPRAGIAGAGVAAIGAAAIIAVLQMLSLSSCFRAMPQAEAGSD